MQSLSVVKECFFWNRINIIADSVNNKELFLIYCASFVKFYLLVYVNMVKQAVLNQAYLSDYNFT
jgi:hypothetical protein